jgi:hypothetical protein
MTPVPAMTPEAEIWITLLQQIIGNSSMGVMTEIAILLYR